MLVQTPSKIFKTDFRIWTEGENNAETIILQNEATTKKLISIREVVCDENADYRISFEENRTIVLLPLYGEIIINDFYEKIIAGETLTFNIEKNNEIIIKNLLNNDKADFILFEFETQELPKTFNKISLNYQNRNNQFPISDVLDIPNFTGIFDGRSEGFYSPKNTEATIFGMVINGAFEFQNRLMETRDAILLWEIEELEFEALSENAIILFFEI